MLHVPCTYVSSLLHEMLYRYFTNMGRVRIRHISILLTQERLQISVGLYNWSYISIYRNLVFKSEISCDRERELVIVDPPTEMLSLLCDLQSGIGTTSTFRNDLILARKNDCVMDRFILRSGLVLFHGILKFISQQRAQGLELP